MPIAFNPETGDALVLFDNEWIKPEKIAQNDKGEIAYLLNNEWVMPGQEPKPKEVEPETSTMGAMGRGVMRGALPSAAGIVTGGAGAVLGSGAGPVGTVLGGLGAGFAGSAAMSAAQEKFLEDNPDIAKTLGLDKETLAKDEKSHPYASFAGELLPNMLALRPSGALLRSGKGLTEEAAKRLTAEKVAAGVNATIGSSVGAGMQVGQEAMGDEPIDWTKVGIAGLAGALGHKETALGRSLSRVGELPASAASKAAVRALRRPGEVTPEMMAEPSIKTPEEFVGGVPKSASQDTEAMMADLEGRAPVEAAKPITEPLAPEAPIIPKEVKAAEEAVVPTKPEAAVAPETVVKTQQPVLHPYEAELKDLYKQRDVLAKEKDDLNLFLRKRGIHPKEKADMGIEKSAKDYPYLFRKDAKGLDVLMHDAIEHGIISESDLAHYSDPVEGFREMAKAAIDGQTANTPKNMETIAKMEAVQSRIEHLESIPKEEYGLKAESPAEAQARMDKELAARKAQEDASVQADMEAQAAKDKAEIARRSEEQAKNFALGQTPEESLTGQKRLDDDIPFDFAKDKIQGTPEQISKAENSLKEQILNAKIAWQEGDIGLVRGYGKNTGEPIYTPYKDGNIYNMDVKDIGSYGMHSIGFNEAQQAKLLKARNMLESEAQIKHEKSPYLKFEKDIEFSPDVSKNIQGVVEEWKKLLGLTDKTYFTTLEHAASIKDEFTGPHRRIGSSSAMREEGGFTSALQDGNRVVAFKKNASTAKNLEIIAHELGHAHMAEYFFKASPEMKEALNNEFLKWAKSIKGETYAKDLVESLRARKVGKTTSGMDLGIKAKDLRGIDTYWRTFKEWYADQTSRWATTQEKPLTTVEKFFSRLGKALKSFYAKAKNAGYLPNETFKQYMDSQVKKLELEPAVQKQSKIPSSEDQITLFSKSKVESIEPPKPPVTAKNVMGDSIGSNWEAPPVNRFTEFTRLFQNKHVDLKRTVEAIRNQVGDIAEKWNPYQKEGLYNSKVANRSRVIV